MVKLLLIRHGHSKTNETMTFAGCGTDPSLSETGKKQAERTCRFLLDNFRIDAIYSSPLRRAIETICSAADALGLPVITKDGLKEINGGEWEGLPFNDLSTLFPKEISDWMDGNICCRCPGGESIDEVQKRAMDAINEICRENDGKTVVVVAHGELLRTVECAMRGMPIEKAHSLDNLPNASVSVVEYQNGKYNIIQMGMVSHIGDIVTRLPKTI